MRGGGASDARSVRRSASRILARSVLISAVTTYLYFAVPLDRGSRTGLWLVLGLTLLTLLLGWQTRGILRSRYPGAQAIGAVTTSIPLLVLLFAAAHHVLSLRDPASYTEPLTRLDAAYFATSTFATVGLGDIAPVTQAARIVTTAQVVVDLVIVGVVAHLVLGAVRIALRRRQELDGTAGADALIHRG